MKYLDEFRDPTVLRQLVEQIRRLATRRWTLMEVCGGQTHSLLRYGIEDALQGAIELIHGPGCPVCVTPASAIDQAIELSRRPGVMLASFGDMLRVPGSRESLLAARATGGDVRMVYSPLDAVRLAAENPEREVVFFAVGFETTAPAAALALSRADAQRLPNFSLLSAQVRVLPAMRQIAESPQRRVQAFLAAGHVATVTGLAAYEGLAEGWRLPIVVAGFEPVDLLVAIRACVMQLEQGQTQLENAYARSVCQQGNPQALALIDRWFEPADAVWRGIGRVIGGGLKLRAEAAKLDAGQRFGLDRADGRKASDAEPGGPSSQVSECRAGEVLLGQLRPTDCPHFGLGCRPEHPLGAPMVSSEGACAAYFRFAAQWPRQPAHGNHAEARSLAGRLPQPVGQEIAT